MTRFPLRSLRPADLVRESLIAGLASGLLSALAVAWGSRACGHRAVAGLNAPSHWLWGQEALESEDLNLRHTAVGVTTHVASALFWGGLYGLMRGWHRRPTPLNAATDAITLTGAAIVTDYLLVPKRLTPGFEERLTPPRLGVVYLALAGGLLLGALCAEQHTGELAKWRDD